jgi:hypothetical protein
MENCQKIKKNAKVQKNQEENQFLDFVSEMYVKMSKKLSSDEKGSETP